MKQLNFMKSFLLLIIFFSSFTKTYSQDPYEFESPNHKADAKERLNMSRLKVKQQNNYITKFDESGSILIERTLVFNMKFNLGGTTTIGQTINGDSIKEYQITDYKTDETIITNLTKDANDNILSSSVIKKDKFGKLIRKDCIYKWNIDTVSAEVIEYRSTKYDLNGNKGFALVYIVNINNDSLVCRTINTKEEIISEHKYYFDSNGNVIKEIRDLGIFLYKFDESNNEIEVLEYKKNGEFYSRKESHYDSNNLIKIEKIYNSQNKLWKVIDYEYEYF